MKKRYLRKLNSARKQKYKRAYGEFPVNDNRFRRSRVTGRKHVNIQVPEVLSLDTNFDEVMEFIEELRSVLSRSTSYFTNFSRLRKIGPCGALLLVSEMDRWRQIRNHRTFVEPENFDSQVLRQFDDMGLFEILQASNRLNHDEEIPGNTLFIKYRSHFKALGKIASELADEIESIAGEIPDRKKLYDALTEAMTNVSHHAYPEGSNPSDYSAKHMKGRWWMSGSFDKSSRKLTIMFIDQGVGIPFTLPLNYPLKIVSETLTTLGLFDSDASRIKAAMELGASTTAEKHRGGGLFRDIRAYTNQLPQGKLRVLSNKGEYVYQVSSSEKPDERLFTHSKSIGGTLILWEGTLPNEAAV